MVRTRVPADFLKAQFVIRGSELAFGLDRAWMLADDVIDVLAWWWANGAELDVDEQEAASVLRTEMWRLEEPLERCRQRSTGVEERLWRYLLLAWLFETRDRLDDPLGEVEKLYADFGHPTEMRGFVRYMPTQEGESIGEGAIVDRWRVYLESTKADFVAERAGGGTRLVR